MIREIGAEIDGLAIEGEAYISRRMPLSEAKKEEILLAMEKEFYALPIEERYARRGYVYPLEVETAIKTQDFTNPIYLKFFNILQ